MCLKHDKSKETHGKKGTLKPKECHGSENTLNQQQKQKGRGKKSLRSRAQPTERDGDFWHQSAFCKVDTGSTKIWLMGFLTACEYTLHYSPAGLMSD